MVTDLIRKFLKNLILSDPKRDKLSTKIIELFRTSNHTRPDISCNVSQYFSFKMKQCNYS